MLLLTSKRQRIIVRAQTDKVGKGHDPDADTKEGGNIAKGGVVTCKILEPDKMVDENEDCQIIPKFEMNANKEIRR